MNKVKVVDFLDYEENVDFKVVTNTRFDDESIVHIYHIDNDVDMELADTLGFGIVEMKDGMKYLYDSMLEANDEYAKSISDGMLKIGIYYQIKYPTHQDTSLEILLNTDGCVDYLKEICNNKDRVDELVNRLNDIFKSQKGKPNNVIPFGRKTK